MTRKILTLIMFVLGTALLYQATAQTTASNLKINAKPKNMWELGINVGHTAITGDVDWNSSFGAGLHLRKAIDYMFSIRLDANYYSFKGDENEDRRLQDGRIWQRVNGGTGFGDNWVPEYNTRLLSGDLNLVASLNNFRTNRNKKLNPYVFVGGGISHVRALAIDGDQEVNVADEGFDDGFEISAHYNAGLGLGFLLSDKVSLSLEHKMTRVVGRGGDLLDAAERIGSAFTPKDDLLHYTNLRLGISLGDKDDKNVPLWWASPIDELAEDLAAVKSRPELDLTDTDEDGVIDMLDKEEATVKGCPVNTRGETLDSDGDGYADCKDKEIYSPPGYEIDSEGIALIPEDPEPLNEADVNRLIDAKMPVATSVSAAPMNWFLPMIHFDNNRYAIRNSEYGKLHNVASVMKQNPGVRIVANGFTDQTAGNCYNDVLSYNRANAAIDYLVGKYGISRDRFVLNWGGENNNLVPTSGSNMMNRRVEFEIATSESEMGRPNCGVNNAGRGGKSYSGNKEAGY